jgi:hypothetical protein
MPEIDKDLREQIVEQFHKAVAEGSLRDFSANDHELFGRIHKPGFRGFCWLD